MRKVLIITYYWPPGGGAGVQRWLKFVKYLREFGWEPVVYTAENGEMPVIDNSLLKDIPQGITIIKTPIWEPYDLYKKFIGRKKEDKINASFLNENRKTGRLEKISVWIRGNFFIPDARRFWVRPSIRYLTNYLQNNPIDHVISSGPPHSMHLIAMGLKKKFPNIKWIADFRDPWTNIDFYEKLMLSKSADKKHHALELKVLLHANLVLSIGEGMSDELRGIYKRGRGKYEAKFKVLANGFDTDDLAKGNILEDEKFSLAHVGTLVKDRNPAVLWKVLSQLVKEMPELAARLQIKLVGKVDIFVKDEIEKAGLSQYVNKIEYLPHDEVIAEQQRSSVLLLLVNNTKNARDILTGKFFEYMAAGPPILAIGPVNGDLAKILEQTASGYISDFNDEKKLARYIVDLFKGMTPPRNEAQINEYSRKELTRKLAAMLEEL